ncbi:thiamine pyrophosphate-binding protein [Comamonas endophytica]|uniref:Thiamine pyrophosphate-binding protein n=2 Tax=Comamonas endophytica TaxID=2949090 RepID=A0ABY6GDF7_9BURK|nr:MULTISPECIES: thiamine pyrophosphate-binding protein [unclassified Acidovorax]MCD2512521.1 thiamine pyrophosphate-binding protein [Acidovorax sp. D4N7]UYG53113.1 thiamine pyrophosphate-binding protein [Acidovorax sp. 5MLIR]
MSIQRSLKNSRPSPELIAAVLEEAGIGAVFGISGGHTGRIFGALEQRQQSIRTVLVREESLAAVMAEVYGRLTRKPGVVLGQGPWVLGNGLVGTIEARLSSSPMLLLTDFSDTPPFGLHAPYQSGTGEYGNWDARQAFGGLVKQVFAVHEPASAVHATQLAVKHALSGQPGPVAVIFGLQALTGEVGPQSEPRLYPTHHYLPPPAAAADPRTVAQAAAALRAARRPVIVAGNGVRLAAAYEALQRFAERSGVPVVTTPSGKGVLAETHDLALGVFGTFGTDGANACVAEADLVLVVGSKLTASDTVRENPLLLDPERQVFVQIDVETRNASWTFPAEHVLLGDAGAVLDQLGEALGGMPAFAGQQRVAGHRARHGHFNAPAYQSDAAPLMPQRIIAEMHAHLPEDAIVTCDAGENRIFMTHCYQTRSAGAFLQAAGAGPMGYGIPAALAAKLVHPERAVVAVVGDGGFAMTMNGLMTAVEQSLPIVVIIFNNQALGWSLHSRGPFATTLGDFDHAAIARGMGCEGVRVHEPSQLGPALQAALASGRPTVIDVMTSLELRFDQLTSPLSAVVESREPQGDAQ